MTAITVEEFAKNFRHYEEEAKRQPLEITSDGRISGYFVSVQELRELERLRTFRRRVYRTEDTPPKLMKLIEASKMEPGHEHLNALLEDTEQK